LFFFKNYFLLLILQLFLLISVNFYF